MTIAALLSGGVDSSVAVHLLCEQGYRPDLFYIKIGMNDDGYSCPQEEDLEIVQAMARHYGLHYEVVDLQKEYWDNVVAYTIDKVKRGFTPNPDVMCNRLIKFGAFDEKVGHLYDKTATGHYASVIEGQLSLDESGEIRVERGEIRVERGEIRVERSPLDSPLSTLHSSLSPTLHSSLSPTLNSPQLSTTLNSKLSTLHSFLATTPDPVKDQTDFLAQLTNLQVAHSLFPIGSMAKGEVRRIAEEAKLPSAHRKDSQGICFLGKINYNEFIERFLGRQEGPIIEIETGKKLGTHQGFWFHTIGQRKGLYLSGGPWFVVKKDIEQNIIYVSKGYQPEAQMADELVMRDMHWITVNPFDALNSRHSTTLNSKLSTTLNSKLSTTLNSKLSTLNSIRVLFKIRHVAELRSGNLSLRPDGSYYLKMDAKTNGVAPGQFCVIYTPDGQVCLGSGEISWD